MKKLSIVISVVLLLVAGCVSTESQIHEAIKKNPKLVFDAIEENPEQFIEVVNHAAQIAQKKQYEKQMLEIKNEQENDLKDPKKPLLEANRRLLGDDNAKIVIVEYADFQCPACGMAYQSLKQFKEKHRGQIQFFYKNMPLDFHRMAAISASYFEAIRLQDKNKALQFYNYVFENQKQLTDENFLKKAANFVHADMKKLAVQIKSDQVQKLIEADMTEFQKFGFTGTPVLILNGVALNGAQNLAELERILKLTTAQ